VDPSLQNNLLFLSRGAVDADDPPVSLGGDWEPTLTVDLVTGTCSFPLVEPEVASAPLWPPAVSIPGMCTPRDSSLVCHNAMSISSSVRISFCNCDLAA
jgi:hypothetical protein